MPSNPAELAQGLAQQGAFYGLAIAIIAIGGLFWLLQKQRDKYEILQKAHSEEISGIRDANKKELVEILQREIATSEKSGDALENIQKAIERLQWISGRQPGTQPLVGSGSQLGSS